MEIFLHRGTPSHHPNFRFGFPWNQPSIWGYPIYGKHAGDRNNMELPIVIGSMYIFNILATFGWFSGHMLVNIPYMEHIWDMLVTRKVIINNKKQHMCLLEEWSPLYFSTVSEVMNHRCVDALCFTDMSIIRDNSDLIPYTSDTMNNVVCDADKGHSYRQ